MYIHVCICTCDSFYIAEVKPREQKASKPRGRPPKSAKSDVKEGPKRPRGRPRKSETGGKTTKRPRGRPRKSETGGKTTKRPRGRPRKSETGGKPTKRPRGRPRKRETGGKPNQLSVQGESASPPLGSPEGIHYSIIPFHHPIPTSYNTMCVYTLVFLHRFWVPWVHLQLRLSRPQDPEISAICQSCHPRQLSLLQTALRPRHGLSSPSSTRAAVEGLGQHGRAGVVLSRS